ncbi:MAG: hypothetical protein GY793_10435 [Proteobacteria bacterium]|nr:hypothetical protein [Pseudomonadota bacterium]
MYDAEATKLRKLAALESRAMADRNMTSVQYLPAKEAIHAEYDQAVKGIENKFAKVAQEMNIKAKSSSQSSDSGNSAPKGQGEVKVQGDAPKGDIPQSEMPKPPAQKENGEESSTPSDIAQKLINNPPVPPTAPDEIQISKEIFKNGMMDDLEHHEKNFEHLYLDSKGNPTIGIGKYVTSKEKFAKLPMTKSDGTIATKEEKEAEYDRMMTEKQGRLKEAKGDTDKAFNSHAENYQQHTTLVLDKEFSKKKAAEHVYNNINSLVKKFPNIGKAPLSVKKALIDMEFNMGGKFTDQKSKEVPIPWTKLFNAVRNEDWKTAAKECIRKDFVDKKDKSNIGERNMWTKAGFIAPSLSNKVAGMRKNKKGAN